MAGVEGHQNGDAPGWNRRLEIRRASEARPGAQWPSTTRIEQSVPRDEVIFGCGRVSSFHQSFADADRADDPGASWPAHTILTAYLEHEDSV